MQLNPTVMDDLAAIPLDYYVVWDGVDFNGRRGSRCARIFKLVTEVGAPVSLRELALRAARLEDLPSRIQPRFVREAVRQHQRMHGACYLLVRKTATGDFVTVAEVPSAAAWDRALPAGEPIIPRRPNVHAGAG